MDYVVAGFGIGAVLALLGFALWELFGSAEEANRGWLGRAAIGSMLGALVIWAVTTVSLFSAIDDSTGSHLVLLTTLVTLVAIAAVSLWYRRAEQSLVASRPAPTLEVRAPETAVNAAPRVGPEEIEPSEWDTWPERTPLSVTDDGDVAASSPGVEFEPEQAVEAAAAAVEPEEGARNLDIPGEEIPLVPDSEIDVLVAEETVPLDEIEIDETPSIPPVPDETTQERPLVRFPENVLAFRPKPPPAGPPPEPVVDEALDIDQQIVPLEEADAIGESERTASVEESVAPAAPAAFESSLLADIDIASAEDGEVRYRSPLLADLDSNADELEEIGLVKWRPEDRLTGDQMEEPQKRRRKR